MPKVKESSLRGILCTFLVNFFEISLLPSFCSLPSSLSFSLSLFTRLTLPLEVHTSKATRVGRLLQAHRLNRAHDETQLQLLLLADLPFPFRSARFSVLLLRGSPFIAARSNANDRARPLWTPQLRPVGPFSRENDCGFCLMGSVEFLSRSSLTVPDLTWQSRQR